jgi:hypothetical protein
MYSNNKSTVFRRKNKDWLNWRIRKTIQYIMLFNNWVLLKEITQHTLYFHFTLTIVVISQWSTFFISSNRWRHALLMKELYLRCRLWSVPPQCRETFNVSLPQHNVLFFFFVGYERCTYGTYFNNFPLRANKGKTYR